MSTIKIKPGILVVASVRCSGGVRYTKNNVTQEKNGQTEATTWETTRIIADKAEHDAATKIRATVRNGIAGACYHTPFGLLCPETDEGGKNEEALNRAISDGRTLAAEFNASARTTRVEVFVLRGRIASTDEEAAEAIAAEVRRLLDDMEEACKAANVDAIRKAANKARNLGVMLEGDMGEQVTEAIKAARSVARQVVKRVEKAGEDAESVLKDLSLKPIETARFVLDSALEELAESRPGEELPAVDARRFSGIDMDDGDVPEDVLDAFGDAQEQPQEEPPAPTRPAPLVDLDEAPASAQAPKQPQVRAPLIDIDEEGW